MSGERESGEHVRRGRRVLLVDDNPDVREAMQLFLEDCGHVVELAEEGPAALELVRSGRPEIVLIDIGLPGADGYAVARAIRALGGASWLVALTGYGEPEDRARAREAGFDAHLTKPVDLDVLEAVLQNAPGEAARAARPHARAPK